MAYGEKPRFRSPPDLDRAHNKRTSELSQGHNTFTNFRLPQKKEKLPPIESYQATDVNARSMDVSTNSIRIKKKEQHSG